MSLFTPIPSVGNHNPIDFPERYYVLAAVAFTGLYFGLSYLSEGYFQDDEVGHFVTAYEFWKDPFSIFTYWSRPGFKILYVIPALFGIKGVHLIASLIAGGTAYLASLLAKEYGVQNRILALVLCGFQPLFYQISFRTYAEIAGAFLLVLMLVFYNRKQFVFSAIVSSYLFSVRQELVILSLLLGVAFLWRREWLAFVWLGWTPVLLHMIGWFNTGDPLWVVNTYLGGGENSGFSKPGFFQYVVMATPIFGTTVVALLLVGLFGMFFQPKQHWKTHLEKYHALYVSLFAVLLMNSILASETLNISSGQGIWRHILTVSPVVAVLATMGFNIARSSDSRQRFGAMLLMGSYALAVFLFFSYEHNYYRYTTEANYIGFLVALGLIYTLLVAHTLEFNTATVVLFTVALTAMHTVSAEKPLKLSAEGKTLRDVVAYYEENGFHNRVTSSNHIMFYYFARIKDRNAPQYPRTTLQSIQHLSPGAIVIWDSHYSYRPVWGHDAHLDSLMSDRTLKPLRSFLSSDKWFSVIVFEKTDSSPAEH